MASDTRQPDAASLPQGVTVTYTGQLALVESPPFKQLLGALITQLPLRNLHWRPTAQPSTSSTGAGSGDAAFAGPSSPPTPGSTAPSTATSYTLPPAIRTIQTLDAHLEPFAEAIGRARSKPETRDLFQQSLLERPYCHIFFVRGDDADAYRSHVRNDIRSWLNTIQTSPNLSAVQGAAKTTAGSFDSIASRLKSDTSGSSGAPGRPQTPPSRPDTPRREGSGSDELSAQSKEKLLSQGPEYLIVVITPPDGNVLSLQPSSRASYPAVAPLAQAGSTMSSDSAQEKGVKTGLGRFYNSSSTSSSTAKATVIEKIRADFGLAKKERIVHLTRLPTLTTSAQHVTRHSHVDPTIFADLTMRLKECVAGTFDSVVATQEEAVGREFSKREIPGWNFNKWMAGAECLANTFEGVGLFADALARYDEIESVFRQANEDKKLPFFFRTGGSAPGDDSAPLLDISKKPYRDLILRNEISLFDFRCYLFAKRAHLLGRMGRVSQVMTETPAFMASVAAMLRDEQLPSHFVESWIFSSSLDVVEQCQAWLVERGDVKPAGIDEAGASKEAIRRAADSISDSQLSPTFHAGKGLLLDTALRQMDKIGISVGHLPRAVPFSLSDPSDMDMRKSLPALPADNGDQDGTEKADSISRQELLDAIENRGVFDLRYTSLAERVMASYVHGQRNRNVLRLRCVLSSLEFFRARYTQAYSTYASLSESYAEMDWTHVEAIHLARHLACHDQLKKPHDRAWVSIILALMRAKISDMKATHVDESTKWLDESNLYSTLQLSSRALEAEVPVSNFEPLAVTVLSQPTLPAYDADDGAQIWATVDNRTSAPVQVDDVRVCIVDGSGRELWFTSGKTEVARGRSTIRVVCPACSDAGIYSVDVTQIRLGKIIFQYNVRQKQKDQATSHITKRPALIHVREDGDAFDLSMEWMPHVHLDRSRIAIVRIYTGRNKTAQANLQISHQDGEQLVSGVPEARLHRAKGVASATLEYDEENDILIVSNLAAYSRYAILVPFHEVQGVSDGVMHVVVDAEYWSQPSKSTSSTASRRIRHDAKLSVGLPLGVNVQDFFRHECLLSKFLISAGNDGPLSLGHVELRPDEDAQDDSSSDESAWLITNSTLRGQSAITEEEPASCAFAIRKNPAFRGRQSPLRLTLAYRTAYEEAAALLLKALDIVCSDATKLAPGIERSLRNALLRRIKTLANMSSYAEERKITFTALDERSWRHTIRQWTGIKSTEDVYEIVDILRRLFEVVRGLSQRDQGRDGSPAGEALDTKSFIESPDQFFWRRLSLPVEVPSMNLVNAITIRLNEKTVRVGVPVKATVHIATSVQWDDEQASQDERAEASNTTSPVDRRKSMRRDSGSDFEDARSDVGADVNGKTRKAQLSVDVQCDFVHWLLVGAKRAVVTVDVPVSAAGARNAAVAHSSVDLSLVALQSGSVPLPSVSIWPMAEPAVDVTPPSNAHRKTLDSNKSLSTMSATGRSGGQGNEAGPAALPMSCDSYLTNEAERVRVLPRHAAAPREKRDGEDDEEQDLLGLNGGKARYGIHQGARFSHTGAVLSAAATVPRETYWVSL